MTSPVSGPLSGLLQQLLSLRSQEGEGEGAPESSSRLLSGGGPHEVTSGLMELVGLEPEMLETASSVVELLLSLKDDPRLTAGAVACYDRFSPGCAAPCGCPRCGCPNGECGCGPLGGLICDCFRLHCLPRRADPSSEGRDFFEILCTKYGPLAVSLAFQKLGMDLAAFLKGEVSFNEEQKKRVKAESRRQQEHLSEVGQEKHDKKVQEALLRWTEGGNKHLEDKIQEVLGHVHKKGVLTQDFPVIYLDVNAEGGVVCPLSAQNIAETLMGMCVVDLDLNSKGSVGSKDAALIARIVMCMLCKWCSSSSTGVGISVTKDLFDAVLSLILLLFGYFPGSEGPNPDLTARLQSLRDKFYINIPLLTNYLLTRELEEVSSGEESEEEGAAAFPKEKKEKGKGKGKLEKGPVTSKDKPLAPSSPIVKDFGSVGHQVRLLTVALKAMETSGSLLEGTSKGEPRPPVTQQPKARKGGSEHGTTTPGSKEEDPLEGTSGSRGHHPGGKESEGSGSPIMSTRF
ncbi:hypothetical protein [Chlamydiifrater volucris]|uniref:hypothetical protein n=1 Tax=Chlamydiifrater volucris TaxID=2681470 RepID=UPI001BCF7C06|nr:hypothetical protein [Chlamydiifrater volucris]